MIEIAGMCLNKMLMVHCLSRLEWNVWLQRTASRLRTTTPCWPASFLTWTRVLLGTSGVNTCPASATWSWCRSQITLEHSGDYLALTFKYFWSPRSPDVSSSVRMYITHGLQLTAADYSWLQLTTADCSWLQLTTADYSWLHGLQGLQNLLKSQPLGLRDLLSFCVFRFDEVMSNPGSNSLNMVSELTNKIQMDHACNIQFTSGNFKMLYISTLNLKSSFA